MINNKVIWICAIESCALGLGLDQWTNIAVERTELFKWVHVTKYSTQDGWTIIFMLLLGDCYQFIYILSE